MAARVDLIRAVRYGLRRPRDLVATALPFASKRSDPNVPSRLARASSSASVAGESRAVVEDLDLVSQLEQRGLIESCSNLDALRALSQEQKIKLYCGFDPTSHCLHLGNLVGIVVLTWFHRYGHLPVALIGGATGRVGDPSGKQSERPLLTEAELQYNSSSIGAQLRDIFRRNAASENEALQLVDNLDWFGEMSLLNFLRDVGKHARLGTMMSKESVKTRMSSEAGISFTEFSYQLLQGYDFYHLCRHEGLSLQIGGSDQWGNITAGLDLIKRLWPSHEALPTAHALTFPLLVDSDGKKFGKSEGGAISLSLSPYKFYQTLFATTDADVVRFLKMLTFVPLRQIDSIEAAMMEAPSSGYVPNSAQRRLAEELTRFVHGEEGLQQALATTEALRPGSETKLDVHSLTEVAGEAPSATLERSEVVDALLIDVLVRVKMQESKGAVKRMMKNGGIRVNNSKIEDEKMKLTEEDLIDGQMLLLSVGKKNKLLLRVQ